jgi:hypothetical protein
VDKGKRRPFGATVRAESRAGSEKGAATIGDIGMYAQVLSSFATLVVANLAVNLATRSGN